jgi:hypothetical protein
MHRATFRRDDMEEVRPRFRDAKTQPWCDYMPDVAWNDVDLIDDGGTPPGSVAEENTGVKELRQVVGTYEGVDSSGLLLMGPAPARPQETVVPLGGCAIVPTGAPVARATSSRRARIVGAGALVVALLAAAIWYALF